MTCSLMQSPRKMGVLRGTPRNRLCRAAGVAPGRAEGRGSKPACAGLDGLKGKASGRRTFGEATRSARSLGESSLQGRLDVLHRSVPDVGALDDVDDELGDVLAWSPMRSMALARN